MVSGPHPRPQAYAARLARHCAPSRRPAPTPEQRLVDNVGDADGSTRASDTGRAGCPREGRSSRGSTLDTRRLGARAGSAGSRRVARGAGANARPGARADPVRAHAPLAACLLPRRGRDDGGRPRACAANRTGRSALGRRASLQLRRLRSLGPTSRLQPERLRRDAARAVRVGRQAPGREPRGGRAGARVRQEAAAGGESHGRPLVPPGAAGLRPSRTLDVWYGRLEVEAIVQQWTTEVRAKRLDRVKRNLAKRTVKDNLRALDKLTEVVEGKRRIVSDPPLIVPLEELVSAEASEQLAEALHGIYKSYRRTLLVDRRQLLDRFRFIQVARKVVGVGSVGTRTWIVLLLGRDDEDPLFLQLKEAQSSVLEPFLGGQRYANQGRRVVEGQRLTQAARDALLGWTRAADVDGDRARLLRAPALGREGQRERRGARPGGDGALRRGLRPHARARARPLGRPDRAGGLPRPQRRLRPGARLVRRDLRGSERTGLRRAPVGRRLRSGEGRVRASGEPRRTAGRRGRRRGRRPLAPARGTAGTPRPLVGAGRTSRRRSHRRAPRSTRSCS